MRLSKTKSKAREKASKKSKVIGVIFALLLCTSVVLALYPTVSKMVNTAYANSSVDNYSKDVDTLPESEITEMLKEAERYNADLAVTASQYGLPNFDPEEDYYDILNVTEEGIMGSIEIPVINVRLPIYHGTDKEFLNEGAGHLIGTSFPIGGDNTHAVISAHTALPGKLLFDKLTEVKAGDTFYVNVLNRTLEYKVTDVSVVLPSEGQALRIVPDKDFVTLVTCTPYSINTHRLLVTGERVPSSYSLSSERDNANSASIDSSTTNSNRFGYVYSIVVLIVIIVIAIIVKRKRSREDEKAESE